LFAFASASNSAASLHESTTLTTTTALAHAFLAARRTVRSLSVTVAAHETRAVNKVLASSDLRLTLVALEALDVQIALVGGGVRGGDGLAARDALWVVAVGVVWLAEELAARLHVLGQRRVAHRASEALLVEFAALGVRNRGAGSDVLVARGALVQAGRETALALSRAGRRLEEIVGGQLLAAGGAGVTLEMLRLAAHLHVRLRLVDCAFALATDAGRFLGVGVKVHVRHDGVNIVQVAGIAEARKRLRRRRGIIGEDGCTRAAR